MGFLGLGKGKKSSSKNADGADLGQGDPTKSAESVKGKKIDTGRMPTRPSRKVVAVTKAAEAPGRGASGKKSALAGPVDTGDELDLLSDIPAAKAVVKPATTAAKKPSLTGAIHGNGPVRSGDAALQQFLLTTAKLITAEQFTILKGKADADNIPYDIAGVALKLFTEEQLVSGLTTLCYVPNLKLDKYGIRKKALDTVPMEDALRWGVIPVDKLGSLLTLAMVNPLDADTVRAIEAKTNLEVKKVVAPRSEILQAIDRYYNGKVEAKDVTLSFSAEPSAEVKSVQQLLGNVKEVGSSSGAKPAVGAKPAIQATPPVAQANDIQDIDDLLAEDEVVAPEIVEALALDGASTSFTANPMVVPPEDVLELPGPALERRPPVLAKPAAQAPVQSPTTRTNYPQNLPGQAKQPQTGVALERNPVVDLLPVLEDEFRHAITHGKAHVFEKWVGLQTRPRVINPIPVEANLVPVLAPVFESRQAG